MEKSRILDPGQTSRIRNTVKLITFLRLTTEKAHNLGVENSTVVQVSRIDGDVYVDLMRKNKIKSTVKTSVAGPGNFGTDPDPRIQFFCLLLFVGIYIIFHR